jgi:quercetin dioxygenase-like cupin family protein
MIQLKSLDLVEVWSESDPSQRVHFAWAISGETGSDATCVAYVELPVGGAIPSHFDSANEIDCVLEGTVEWEFDGKRDAYGAGTLIEIPAGRKHTLRNVGTKTARVLIYLDRAKDVVTFDEPLMPIETSVVES